GRSDEIRAISKALVLPSPRNELDPELVARLIDDDLPRALFRIVDESRHLGLHELGASPNERASMAAPHKREPEANPRARSDSRARAKRGERGRRTKRMNDAGGEIVLFSSRGRERKANVRRGANLERALERSLEASLHHTRRHEAWRAEGASELLL